MQGVRRVAWAVSATTIAVALALAVSAHADHRSVFTVTMNGSEVVPPSGSAGTGSGTFTINTATNKLCFDYSFSNLGSPVTTAHIHGFAAVGAEAGTLFNLPVTSPASDCVSYSQSDEANLLAGLTYIDIHTSNFSDGEIRGQIDDPVPEAHGGADAFEVTRRGDPPPGPCLDDDCSLREAVIAANAAPGADKIRLPSAKLHQLSIGDAGGGTADGDLDVTDPLTILHPGRGRAVIDFNPPNDPAPGPLERVFEATSLSAPLTLKKLELREGGDPAVSGRGGALRALGDLRLIGTKVTNSEAPDLGGGISVEGGADLTLKRSSVVRNETTGNAGGGISLIGGGEMSITTSEIARNRASSGFGDGGAFYFSGGPGESQITRSTIANNRAGEDGGGIYGDGGALRITGSTFAGNRAVGPGGAIHNDDFDLTMVNSTIAGNRSDSNGAGIFAGYGENVLNGVSVVRNFGNADGVLSESGAGLFAGDFITVFDVSNSLIALNKLGGLMGGDPVPNDCDGSEPFTSGGFNLLSTDFLCDDFDATGDIVRAHPKLAKLADNGGPTETIALKAGSPAIGKADPNDAPGRDQRGVKRDAKPDIGAFER
jgi:hypothetical protein